MKIEVDVVILRMFMEWTCSECCNYECDPDCFIRYYEDLIKQKEESNHAT